MRNLYISDSHFGHANIIKYAARPFPTVMHMDQVMWERLVFAAERGRIIHGGDLCLNSGRLPHYQLPNAARHLLVRGNHDPDDSRDELRYLEWFGTVHGTRKTWRTHGVVVDDVLDGRPVRVLVSHEPQPVAPWWDYNVYGHHHTNLIRNPEFYGPGGEWGDYTWLRGSERHFNACAELVDYRPTPLEELRLVGIWW